MRHRDPRALNTWREPTLTPNPHAEPESSAPARRRKPRVHVKGADRLRQHDTPDPETGAHPPPPGVTTRSQGRELARKLRAQGVDSARWTRDPNEPGEWLIDVTERDEPRAREMLQRLAAEQGGNP